MHGPVAWRIVSMSCGTIVARGGTMAISEHAGRPADPSMLVDVDRLVRSYLEIRPDPADPAQRVAFGTSGHRGSSLNGAFN